MDERNLRTERTPTESTTGYDRDVDIRRTMIMGRDLDMYGNQHVVAAAPMNRILHWGPIMAGLCISLVTSLLLGALFLGLGFDRSFGVFGGLTSAEFGWGAAIASLIAVFIGSYITGNVSDLRSKAEGIWNGFMVGVMTILTPLVLAALGTFGAATAASTNLPDSANPAAAAGAVGTNVEAAVPESVEAGVRNALTVAADNAWMVFLAGALILAVATIGGYLGAKSREKAIEASVKRDLDTVNTY